MTHDEFMEAVHKKGRDNARTPFQWDDSENAGFSSARPWLKVNPRYKEINAEKDRKSPDSIYYWYQKLIRLRKEMEIITEGDFNLLFPDDEDIFAYMRTFEDERLIVVGNFSGKTREIELDGQLDGYEILLKNYDERLSISNRITVKPWEVFALYRGAKIA
jgi:glycosidase